MKASHSFGIDFIVRACKSDKASGLIFARITVDGDRKEISLKESIQVKEWDSAGEIVKGKSIEIKSINHHIGEARFHIKEKYRLLEEKQCEITAEAVKEAYLGVHAIQRSKYTLCELRQYHTKIEGQCY